ncbi:MAG: right-handed parallel beta-helix repeat-containing protein [Candidatus Hodarchaeales archaeon]|jgi:parallel beta-helix repeat protein
MNLKRSSFLFLMIVLFVFNTINLNQSFKLVPNDDLSKQQVKGQDKHSPHRSIFSVKYQTRDPIYIYGNDNFSDTATTKGWVGDGMKSTPIIIEGFNISGSDASIKIVNTSLFFQIRSCLLIGGNNGIYLSNVTNGYIVENTIHNANDDAIDLRNSYGNTITNNTLYNNIVDGIFLDGSCNNTILNNTCFNNGQSGINVYSYGSLSRNNSIKNNNLINNEVGIINFAQNSTIANNTILNSTNFGILLFGLNNNANAIINNNLTNCGLFIYGSEYGLEYVLQKKVSNNMVNGRPLIFWQNVQGDAIPSNAGQIFLVNCSSIDVINQNLSNASFGLFVAYSSCLNIQNNEISNNSQYGIYITSNSKNNTIILNNFTDNKWHPAPFFAGTSQAFDDGSNNTFENNYWSEWTSPDDNFDGIIDNPYLIDGSSNSKDLYPLGSHHASYTPTTLIELIQGNDSCEFSFVGSPIIEEIDYTNNGLSDYLMFTQTINVTQPGMLLQGDWDLFSLTFFNDSDITYTPGLPSGDFSVHFLPSEGLFNISSALDGSRINSPLGSSENYLFLNVTSNFALTPLLFNGSSKLPGTEIGIDMWMGIEKEINTTYSINNPSQWDACNSSSRFATDTGIEIISPIRNILRKINGINREIGAAFRWYQYIFQNKTIDITIKSVNNTFLMVNETVNDNGTLLPSKILPYGVGFDDHFHPSFFIPKGTSKNLAFAYMFEKAFWFMANAAISNISSELDFWEVEDFLFINATTAEMFGSYQIIYFLPEGILVQEFFTALAIQTLLISPELYPEVHTLSVPTLSSPNGGETLLGTTTIQWATSNDSLGHTVTYTLSYSADGGSTWIILESGLTTTSYDWDTTTVIDGTNYLIQVNATCSEGLWQADTSDSAFIIDNPEVHAFSIPTVTSPNGGETLVGDVIIQWSASTDSMGHDVNYTVSYSADGGSTWIILEIGLTTTSYDWDTTMPIDSTNYLIQVNASCSGGLWQVDISDSTFTIYNEVSTTPSSTTEPSSTTVPTSTSKPSSTTESSSTTVPTSTSKPSSTTEPSTTRSWTFSMLFLPIIAIIAFKKLKRRSE